MVITACGAGTLIECLSAGKCVIMVVNTKLDGNHQNELAEKLLEICSEGNQNSIRKAVPETVFEVLQEFTRNLHVFSSLKKSDEQNDH